MLEKNFTEVYEKFELIFFRRIFEKVRERDGSLSAMEAFSLEVIYLLHEPTVGQFADFLNISQSNATYKVNSLIKKGYIETCLDRAGMAPDGISGMRRFRSRSRRSRIHAAWNTP